MLSKSSQNVAGRVGRMGSTQRDLDAFRRQLEDERASYAPALCGLFSCRLNSTSPQTRRRRHLTAPSPSPPPRAPGRVTAVAVELDRRSGRRPVQRGLLAPERRPSAFEPFDEELSSHFLRSAEPLSPNGYGSGTSYYDEMSPPPSVPQPRARENTAFLVLFFVLTADPAPGPCSSPFDRECATEDRGWPAAGLRAPQEARRRPAREGRLRRTATGPRQRAAAEEGWAAAACGASGLPRPHRSGGRRTADPEAAGPLRSETSATREAAAGPRGAG